MFLYANKSRLKSAFHLLSLLFSPGSIPHTLLWVSFIYYSWRCFQIHSHGVHRLCYVGSNATVWMDQSIQLMGHIGCSLGVSYEFKEPTGEWRLNNLVQGQLSFITDRGPGLCSGILLEECLLSCSRVQRWELRENYMNLEWECQAHIPILRCQWSCPSHWLEASHTSSDKGRMCLPVLPAGPGWGPNECKCLEHHKMLMPVDGDATQ